GRPGWLGKPHPEQGQAERPRPSGRAGWSGPNRRSGRLLETPGNRRPREMAVMRARPFGRRSNRTRLTGPLRDFFSHRPRRDRTWSRCAANERPIAVHRNSGLVPAILIAELLRWHHLGVDHLQQLADAKLIHAGLAVVGLGA